MESKVSRLRVVAILEGISFLVLLFIAMPIKYIGGEPIVVKYVGMAHGVLFILFMIALYDASRSTSWTYAFRTLAFISSLIPFGAFWLEVKLKKPALIPVRK
jgi:integral membrane protein